MSLVFDKYLSGERLVDIATMLEEMGAPTPNDHYEEQLGHDLTGPWRDAPWSARYVARILDNPVYTGILSLGNFHQSLYEGIPFHVVPQEERHLFENMHEALVSPETFEKVRKGRTAEKAEKRARVTALEGKRDEMPDKLRGLIFCAECGGRMLLDRRFNPKTGEARGSVYKCRKHHGRGCDNDVILPERIARIAIMDAIRVQVTTGLEFEKVLPGLRDNGAVEQRRNELSRKAEAVASEASALSTRHQALYERYAEGGITVDEYKKGSRAIEREANTCAERLRKAEEDLADLDGLLSSDAGFDEAVEALDDLFSFSRDLAVALIKRIEVDREGNLAIEFRFRDWTAKAEEAGRMVRC